jgi:hypothetical protein
MMGKEVIGERREKEKKDKDKDKDLDCKGRVMVRRNIKDREKSVVLKGYSRKRNRVMVGTKKKNMWLEEKQKKKKK